MTNEAFEAANLPSDQLKVQFPNGLQKEQACIETDTTAERSCQADPGSPTVVPVYGTQRGTYYEQHYLLSSGFDCKLSSMVYTKISSTKILSWVQKVTGHYTLENELIANDLRLQSLKEFIQ